MKRLFRKDNRIARFIAMWLVFIMALTPLYEHSGLKNPTKAAAVQLTGPSIDVSLQYITLEKIDNGEGVAATYNVPSAFTGDANGYATKADATEVHYYGDEVTSIKFSASVSVGADILVYPSGYQVNKSYFDVLTVTHGAEDNIPVTLDNLSQTSNDSAANGQYYAVYVKLQDEFMYRPDSSNMVTVQSSGNKWTLQKLYKVVKDDVYLTSEAIWKNGSNVVDGKTTNAATISPSTKKAEVTGLYVGKIQYTYAKYDNTNTDITKYSNFIVDHSTTVPDTSGLTNGKYIAWVSYSDGTNTYNSNGKVVTIDAIPPQMSDNQFTTIYSNVSPYEGGQVDNTQTLYLDSSKTYTITINTKEDNPKEKPNTSAIVNCYKAGTTDLVAIKEVPRTFNSGGYQVYKDTDILADLPDNEAYDLKLVMKDELGNDGGEELLAKVYPIDKSLQITATGTLTTPTNTQQTITVTASSGDPLDKLIVYDDNHSEDNPIATYDLSGVTLNNQLYSISDYTVVLPRNEDLTANQTYKNIKIKIFEAGAQGESESVDVHSGEYVYDREKPTVTELKLYHKSMFVDDDNAYVQINADQMPGGYYITDDWTDYKFQFKVSDVGSGVKSVIVYSDTNKTRVGATITPDENGWCSFVMTDGTIEDFFFDGSNNGSATLCIEVQDNAGNYAGNGGLVPITPTFVTTDKMLRIDKASLVVAGSNQPVEINSDSSETYRNCNAFELTLTVSSRYPIDTISFTNLGKDGEGNDIVLPLGNAITISDDENDASIDNSNKRYTITKTIFIPNSVDEDTINMLINKVKVTVTDQRKAENGDPDPQTATRELGNLLYDATKPSVAIKAVDSLTGDYLPDTNLTADGVWYQGNYAFEAIVTPGSQAIETNVEAMTYNIENSNGYDVNDSTDHVVIPYKVTEDGPENAAKLYMPIPESKTAAGTKITLMANDQAGNKLKEGNVIIRRIDATAPSINVDQITINGDKYSGTPVGKTVSIVASAKDNLAIGSIVIEVENEDGTVYYKNSDYAFASGEALNEDSDSVTGSRELKLNNLPDGVYTITVNATDKAGWPAEEYSAKFEVDGTAPVVTAKISAGTTAENHPIANFDGTNRDKYYRSDATVSFTSSDKNIKSREVTDIINGKTTDVSSQVQWKYNSEKKVWEGTYTATADANTEVTHKVTVTAKDRTGNSKTSEVIDFVVDKKAPVIGASFNGLAYQDSEGVRLITSNATLAITETENYKNPNGVYYSLIKKVPDEAPVTGDSLPTPHRSFTYSEEAEYTVMVYAVDMAGNVSATRNMQIRIDKTAPNITIGGITSGGTSSSAVNISLNMQEIYWNDATGTVEIYMKSGEGFGEELIDEITYTPTGRNTSIGRNFSESGIYRIEFNARDGAGHTAEASSTFTIDTDVPVVTLDGVSNYDVTDKDVVISSTITDKFYASKRVSIVGTMTDETGKVTPITIDDYNPSANPTTINKTFSADGIYELTISCVDVAGNTDSKSVHFTIDKSDPVIGDLSKYEDKILTSFEWDEDLDELVSDLTVCDVHMYLNGQEYNGEDAVEDGSYVLLITAEDELGHVTEKSVEFVLDTKSPVFIVTGVEDGEKKLEPYKITVSVQLDEDTLDTVTLNGQVITFTGNTVTIDVTEIGEYKLYMEAYDQAGNVASAEYEFELMSEKEFNFWIIAGILGLLAIIILIIILRRKKKDNE